MFPPLYNSVALNDIVYPGTAERRLPYKQLHELAEEARSAGLAVVVWAYPRGNGINIEDPIALDAFA